MTSSLINDLEKRLSEILLSLGLDDAKTAVLPTEDLAHGDYTTNIALVGAKILNKNPQELARLITEKIESANLSAIERVEIAGPGFINFFLKPTSLIDNIRTILRVGDEYGRNNSRQGQKIMVEFTDPNPFKEFHIGHLMTNTIGESLSRIIEASGAEVKRVNYQGDVGMHVAKAVWGVIKTGGAPTEIGALSAGYVFGAKAYETAGSAKLEINELNKKIYDRSDEAINKIYDVGRQTSLDYFAIIYQKLDTQFDFNFFESETGEFGKRVVLEFLERGVFERSEGAVIFPGEKYNLHTRVFINSQGLPTYEAKELGLAKIKYDHYPYDRSIIVTCNEVDGYFQVLLKAMTLVYPDLESKTSHIGHGMLRLPTGKMSSRTGEVISADSFIEEVKARALLKMKVENRVTGDQEKVAEVIAIGAIKYSILKQDIGRDIIFDYDQSISLEGNSGPYLQYMYARICSVLDRADQPASADFTNHDDISILERLLIRYPEIIDRTEQEMAPHYLATYLFTLSSAFSAYYAKEKILGVPQEAYRLALSSAVRQVLKNGLFLLGMVAPARM